MRNDTLFSFVYCMTGIIPLGFLAWFGVGTGMQWWDGDGWLGEARASYCSDINA
jgi:hypothetical protein